MKIIERVVEATHEPNKNDLWLKPEEGGSATLNRYAGGQWRPIVGSGGNGGSGSGCDCDTSDFIRVSDLLVTFPYSAEDLVYIEEADMEALFIEDNNVEKRMSLASAGILRSIRLTRENGMSDIVLAFNDDRGYFVTEDREWQLTPADFVAPFILAALDIPEDSTGWMFTEFRNDVV